MKTAAQLTVLVRNNAERTAKASPRLVARARHAIECDHLSDERRAVLALRIEHPGKSLSELAALHEPPLTKAQFWSLFRTALRIADGPMICSDCRRQIPINYESCPRCREVVA
ncbi:helix-turn-helix domain-containing protein [Mycobacterium sp. CSUR Q5927]|nr:helix-turn-helix domain-containing protein [Mycobacterium sp. CSUR Q5927]